MIQIGTFNKLRIDRDCEHGLYLENADGDDVLIPMQYVPDEWEIDDEVTVFVYNDSEDRIVATTLNPKIQLNQYAVLEISSVSKFGAFADWGLPKDLLIPSKNQGRKLVEGDKVLVYMYLDEETNRLVGTTKLGHLKKGIPDLLAWEEVELIVANRSDLGWNVIINEQYLGIVYENEVFRPVRVGDRLKGYIKKVRDDGKIDVSFQKQGYGHVEPNAEKILEVIRQSGGKLYLTDKSDPDEIVERLQMSKKTFKKSIGGLYKQRLIRLEVDGICLNE